MAKKLFFSFSVSGDADGRHFVRGMLARLHEQAIDPWIYESPGGRIQSGDSIALACRQRIEESDFFVLLVNDQALRSDYVAMEVSHALWLNGQRRLPVYPIVSTGVATSDWPPHLREAVGYRGIQARLDDDTMETSVYDICARLELDYVPPRAQVPRLPFAKRLADELHLHRAAGDCDMDDFRRLLDKSRLASESLARSDHDTAGELASSILTDLKLYYRLPRPYYPRVFLGATLLGKAESGQLPYEQVRSFFDALIGEQHAALDGNAFAGRAHASMALGRYEEALADYRAAEARLEARDPALLYNIARAQVLAGLGVDLADLRRWREEIRDGLATTQLGDLSKIASVLALGHAQRGEPFEAQAAWEYVADPADVFPEVVAEMSEWLCRDARSRGARAPLQLAARIVDECMGAPQVHAEDPGAILLHARARIHFDLGESRSARERIDELVHRHPVNPLFAVDAAMFALADGDRAAAFRLCHAAVEVLNHADCRPPLGAAEFNLAVGQAFWLLGQAERAEEGFRRSGLGRSMWYGETLADEFGAAIQGRGSRRLAERLPFH